MQLDTNLNSESSILRASNMLSFAPQNLVKEYMVKAVVSKTEDKNEVLLYRVRVTWNAFQKEGFLVKLETKDFLINYKDPSLMIELLAAECRKPLQKIVIWMNAFGQIESLFNYEEIVESWQKVKENLALKYSGEVVEKYIKLQDAVISDSDYLLFKLKKDLFFNHFFYPIYNNVFRNFKLEVVEKSNFLNVNYEFPMQFLAQNQGQYDENNQLKFIKRINEKEYDFEKMPVSFYEAKYVVNKDHSIHSIEGNFEALAQKLSFSIYAVPDTKAFDT